MWLPLDKCWSVDNVLRLKRRKPRPTTYVFNMATVAGALPVWFIAHPEHRA